MDADSPIPDDPAAHSYDDAWIVVPAYNEERVVGSVVGELLASFPHVVLVDDGSSDATGLRASEAGARVLRHGVNLGQGAGLQTGITFALRQGAERIGTFDADGQHRISDLAALLDAVAEEGCEIALGSRFLGSGASIPWRRRTLLRCAVLFTRSLTSLRITDAHNGLRAFSRRAASILDIRSNRMAHASEILDQIARSGLPYRELPVEVRYTDYSLAKGQRSRDAFRVLFDYLVARVFD